jgi:hypothetical protein
MDGEVIAGHLVEEGGGRRVVDQIIACEILEQVASRAEGFENREGHHDGDDNENGRERQQLGAESESHGLQVPIKSRWRPKHVGDGLRALQDDPESGHQGARSRIASSPCDRRMQLTGQSFTHGKLSPATPRRNFSDA